MAHEKKQKKRAWGKKKDRQPQTCRQRRVEAKRRQDKRRLGMSAGGHVRKGPTERAAGKRERRRPVQRRKEQKKNMGAQDDRCARRERGTPMRSVGARPKVQTRGLAFSPRLFAFLFHLNRIEEKSNGKNGKTSAAAKQKGARHTRTDWATTRGL